MKKGSKSDEKRQKALSDLRKFNPQDDEKVEKAMSQISEEDLREKEAIIAFRENITNLRKNHQLGVEEVAEKLGFSHTTIQNLELSDDVNSRRKNKEHQHKKINRNTLEAFSLFYKVSPLYLIGKTDQTGNYGKEVGCDPLFNDNPVIVDMARSIIERLIENNKDLLIDFLKVSDYSFNHRPEIKQALLSSPLIKSITAKELIVDVIHKDWMRFCIMEQSQNNKLISACNQFFRRLGVLDYQLLELMTYIALADHDTQSKVHTFLNDMGYISPKYRFVHIDSIENVAQAQITTNVKNIVFEQRFEAYSKQNTDPSEEKKERVFEFDSFGILPDIDTQK